MMSIYSDDGVGAPHTLLLSQTVNVGASFDPSICESCLIVSTSTIQNPLLTAGRNYWVSIVSVDPTTNPVVWYFASVGTYPAYFISQRTGPATWAGESPQPTAPLTLRVDSQSTLPTPEPASLGLIGSGLGALAWIRSRQRGI